MDTYNLLMQAISTVGFPMVCCFAMFKYIEKKDNAMEDQTKIYDHNLDELTGALNNNTRVMEALVSRLEKE